MNRFSDFDPATIPQVRAADPSHPSWVSANAGSGKTKVLTDRVARLLLSGTPPQRILCLTFTIAAASNMQNRLFERLGEWSMLPDDELIQELLRLGEDGDSLNRERLRLARTLFARALETPGGLKIQTIHAFASAILKQFPLEAGISPQFVPLDDRTARRMREEILDMVSQQSPATFREFAGYTHTSRLPELIEEISGNRRDFACGVDEDELCRIFGIDPPIPSPDAEIRRLITEGDVAALRQLVWWLGGGRVSDQRAAGKLNELNLDAPARSDFDVLQGVFLFGPSAREPYSPKTGRFPTKDLRESFGDIGVWLNEFMNRVADARPRILSAEAAERTLALHRFAEVFLSAYEQRKRLDSSLDFDDLILKAVDLLNDPETAQWVLYKLDGGIDHILVDEAQDVSRTQWSIITAIAEEFTSGKGARERDRTVFAVGDEKQSIYGFQGAAPEKFEEMRDHFQERYTGAGQAFIQEDLEYSFRSSPAILEVVDRIFADRTEPGFGGGIRHRAFKSELPGRVDLWPMIEESDKPEPPEWHGALLVPSEMRAQARLAKLLASEIRRITDPQDAEQIETGGMVRPVQYGDILILVRRRNVLFHSIISELKNAGLPVAGTDRMKLTENLAVRDLRAMLSFLATRADDLSLAVVLRSPIFGMTEGELYSVAHGRGRNSLWNSLKSREGEFPETVTVIKDLLLQVDRLKPYELIEHLLTVHKGRELLTARLGNEISEPLDAFLHQAITYDDEEASTLTGFLEWSSSDFEIKRQLDQAGNEIRVMTVHGAKGLESPIVVLPDTCERRIGHNDSLLFTEDGVPLWAVPKNCRPDLLSAAAQEYERQAENEHLRLLYVALTRAESWLIVAGAGKATPESWFGQIESGLAECAIETVPTTGLADSDWPFAAFRRHSFGSWPLPGVAEAGKDEPDASLPSWVRESVPQAEPPAAPRSPSRLGGDKVLPSRATRKGGQLAPQPDDSLERGTMIHLLLEHLPAGDSKERQRHAYQILACEFPQLAGTQFEEIYGEACRILDNPELAFLFGDYSLAEVGITARLDGLDGDTVLGYVDRLVLEKGRVLAVDFKSNALVPAGDKEVPEGILRQLGAYHEALQLIYPDRRVDVAVLWTRTGEFMQVDPELCSEALKRSDPAGGESELVTSTELDEFGESFK